MRRLALLPLVFCALLASGCGQAIFSIVSFRSHDAYTDAALARFYELIEVTGGDVSKAQVLFTLGPPIQVVGQDEGEIFIYRRLARDTSVINLNPSMITFVGPMPPIPIYFASDSSGRDDTLMLFFDREGRLANQGLRLGVGEGGHSPAARMGEGVQEMIK